jgi:hypothetical protein
LVYLRKTSYFSLKKEKALTKREKGCLWHIACNESKYRIFVAYRMGKSHHYAVVAFPAEENQVYSLQEFKMSDNSNTRQGYRTTQKITIKIVCNNKVLPKRLRRSS